MSTPLFPSSSLDKTRAFYERLGFSVLSQQEGEKPTLLMEKEDIVIKFYLDPHLQPLKNRIFNRVMSRNIYSIAASITESYRPENPGDEGWILPLKNDEFHIVDHDGNLLMIGKKDD